MNKQVPSKDETVTLIAVGDLALHGQYDSMVEDKGLLFAFNEVASFFKSSDIVFGNLESVLSNLGRPNPNKRLCLRGNPSIVSGLRDAGFNILSLANNHSFDFGTDAYHDMETLLQSNGIRAVGAGNNMSEAREPLIFECKGIRILFLAYSDSKTNGFNDALSDKAGVAPLVLEMIKEDISRNKDKADCLIVSLHWGEEFSHYPTPEQLTIAREIIDSGAKIVLGHHSHVLQGIERYKDGVIAYNLGSLVMSGPSGSYRYQLQKNNRESIIFNCNISREGISNIKIIPTWLNDNMQPTICNGQKRYEILEKMKLLSEKVAEPGYPEFWEEMVIKNRVKDPIKEWLAKGNYLRRVKNLRPSDIKRPINLVISYLKIRFKNH